MSEEEINIDGIPTKDYGTPYSQSCYSENYTINKNNLSEEEKKAIEILRFSTLIRGRKPENDAVEILLNLIEKQQKEIKKLNKYVEERCKIGKDIQTFINKDYVNQEFISKDKLKELKKIIDIEHDKAIIEFMRKKENFTADADVAQTLNWISGKIEELLKE